MYIVLSRTGDGTVSATEFEDAQQARDRTAQDYTVPDPRAPYRRAPARTVVFDAAQLADYVRAAQRAAPGRASSDAASEPSDDIGSASAVAGASAPDDATGSAPAGTGPSAADDAGGSAPADARVSAPADADERTAPRWVWDDTRVWYPELLTAGIRVDRCVDLRLCHAILRASSLSARSALALAPASGWDASASVEDAATTSAASAGTALFDTALFDLAELGVAAGDEVGAAHRTAPGAAHRTPPENASADERAADNGDAAEGDTSDGAADAERDTSDGDAEAERDTSDGEAEAGDAVGRDIPDAGDGNAAERDMSDADAGDRDMSDGAAGDPAERDTAKADAAAAGPAERDTANAVAAHADADAADTSTDPALGDTSAELAEFLLQLDAVAGATEPGRLRLLLAAESAGALIAAEMRFAGLPWRSDIHNRLLTDLLGERPRQGVRPAKLEALAVRVQTALDAPTLNPDSQAELLRALGRTGLIVTSTRSWELKKLDHPAIEPLLEYKKLSRLQSANGWAWMDAWIRDGRFHPDYVPGGVVTGRWATRGGGALQLPKQVRGAVVADPGWKLIVADAAQLEPRILTGMAGDTAMADAGRGKDLYEGIVASGAVDERAQAKVAMLGAMYGATTGESGRLMPRLTRAFPRAIRLVEDAARAGERGEIVTTRLGRSSPRPGVAWAQTQGRASAPDSTPADERRARSQARDWGRFTRNFVVQGSAAEWALCWMAELRKRLNALSLVGEGPGSERPDGEGPGGEGPGGDRPDGDRHGGERSGGDRHGGERPGGDRPGNVRLEAGPHLVYFLHDEVIVHSPERLADRVAQEVVESARAAGRLLFGDFPVEFPVTTAVVDSYADAK